MPVVRGATAAAAVVQNHRRHHRQDDNPLPPPRGPPALERGLSQRFWSNQSHAQLLYNDLRCQILVACLIGANFIVNIVEAQVGTNRRHKKVFKGFEWFFFVIFWCELLLNMYSSWWRRFWRDGWNIFDFVVVMVSTLEFAILRMVGIRAGGLRILRMMRAFRVFRLFKRVRSLNKIVISLARALPGMLNALFILFLIMCIYAIIGYQFFHDWPCKKPFHQGPGSCQDTIDHFGVPDGFPAIFRRCGKHNSPGYGMNVVCRSAATFGHEYFGNFLKAMYTLFQVLTGESWSEVIGRALLEKSPYTAIYFVSFILINSVVMINVVVAVLLEKMVIDADDDDDDDVPNLDDDSRYQSSFDNDYANSRDFVHASSSSASSEKAAAEKQQPNNNEAFLLRRDLRDALEKIDRMQSQLDDLTTAMTHLTTIRDESCVTFTPDDVDDEPSPGPSSGGS